MGDSSEAMKKTIIYFSFFSAASIIALTIILAFMTTSFSPDEGYYLSIARDLLDGKKYFIDIASPYNPLSILYYTIPLKLGLATHAPIYLFNWLILILNASLFFLILKQMNIEKTNCIVGSLFYFVVNFFLDGKYILLEPLSVFFQLLAFLCFLKFKTIVRFLLIGLLIGLSFFSKQYGAFLLGSFSVYLIYNKQLKETMLLVFGFFILILGFEIWFVVNGGDWLFGIKSIIGKGIDFDYGNGTGQGYTLVSYLIGYLVFISLNIIPIHILIKNKFRLNSSLNMLLLFNFLCSLLPLVFASFFHYFQYVLPHFLLLAIVSLSSINFSYYDFRIPFMINIVFLFGIIFYNFKSLKIKNQNQYNETAIIQSYVPRSSSVYLDGINPAVYYLCNYKSINLRRIGYFPGYFNENSIEIELGSDERILTHDSRKYNKLKLLSKFMFANKYYYVYTK